MRASFFLFLAGVLLLSTVPVNAQNAGPVLYRVEIDGDPIVSTRANKQGLFVTVKFRVRQADDRSRLVAHLGREEIVVEEDKKRVEVLDLYRPQGGDKLTAVLALDTSGSMSENGATKMDEAKRAANVFLDRLPAKGDCGLVLFNHEVYHTDEPARKPDLFAGHREQIRNQIQRAVAEGGTAYLDAASVALDKLRGIEGRNAIIVMTDGVDINSKSTLDEVITRAKEDGVPVYTIGVGEPGKQEKVSTVMVLDHSGSMATPANATDRDSKIEALKVAAGKFVEIMRPGAVTTVLPFSTVPETPKPLTDDKKALLMDIKALKAKGGTALFDGTFNGIETLEAAGREGKRAVVVLTDGIDEAPGSRHRVEEVIARAKETKTPLYMLGLGRDNDIDERVMKRMAEETGGKFYLARDAKQLISIFENISIKLHDDGIDEASLKKLAEDTGGKYFLARNIKDLEMVFQDVAADLESSYTVTYASPRQATDGTARAVDVKIMQGGVAVSEGGSKDYAVHGVVVPEMSPGIYLALLGLLGVLIAFPSGVRKMYKFYGGA